MRRLILILLLFLSVAWAEEINISAVTEAGRTVFFLQAGTFSLVRDALLKQKELSAQINQPIKIKTLTAQHLYLLEIGPIENYQEAKALQSQISKKPNQEPPVEKVVKQEPKIQTGSRLWNLRNADLRAVIAEVSRVTGKNFVIDPRVQGKVSIISATPLSNHELYQVFLSVLQISGYAAIPTGDIVKIVPNVDAKTLATDSLNKLRNPPRGEEIMVAVVPIHYVPAEQLVPVLRPLMPQWSSLSAYPPSNMLILSGQANQIKQLTEIIKQVDSSTSSGIDVVHLKHALAMDIANSLKDLTKTQNNYSMRTAPNVSADDRSNTLLISGSQTDRIRLRMLILKLDRASATGINASTRVVYLNYLRAEDLVPILAGIAQANFSGTVGTTIGTVTRPPLDSTMPASSLSNNNVSSGSGNPSLSDNTPAVTAAATEAMKNTSSVMSQNEGSAKPSIQIIAEPNTNSIILNAPASIIQILVSVIAQLDIKPEQLLIEALVVEVDESNVNDLGIEWGSTRVPGNSATFVPGFAIINSRTSIDSLQAQIYALAREKKANILSTPSVVVLDNRQAKILVGKQVSVAATSYPNNAGGTTVASPFTTFERVNVALHLYVRPQITRGDGIQMQIDQGNDTIDPVSAQNITNPGFNPTFKISSIVTSVHVDSGNIIVLGGLTQNGLDNNDNRLPILGDAPGIGRFFQRNIHTREKRVLMVFIKPIILRNEGDNLQVSGEKYNETRQYQLDWIRSQERYDQMDNETVLPPLTLGNLPMPFSSAPPPCVVEKRLIRPWK